MPIFIMLTRLTPAVIKSPKSLENPFHNTGAQ